MSDPVNGAAPLPPDEMDRLAAEYVLGLLEAEEDARASALDRSDAAFGALVEAWRLRFAELDATAAPGAPDAALLDRIVRSIDLEPAVAAAPAGAGQARPERSAPRPAARAPAAPSSPPRPSRAPLFGGVWESLAFWRGAGFAASAAAVLLAIGLAAAPSAGPKPTFVAVLMTPDNQAAAVVNAFDNGTAELIPLRSIAVPEGRALEVWTLQDRARGPVSIGLLDRARTVRLDLKNLPDTGPDQLFEITLEPQTGSPIGRPTGPILMKGTTSAPL